MDKIKKKVSKRKLRVENEVKKAKPKQKQAVIGAKTRLQPKLSMPEPKKDKKESVSDIEFPDEEDLKKFNKERQCYASRRIWTDRELRDLAYALQVHGFADEDKLQAEVKTKSVNDIRAFLKSRVLERAKAKAPETKSEKHRGRPKNQWTSVSPEVFKTWPTVRKWRRVAYEQMLPDTRAKDYSGPVISALCKKFYEEEPEPADAQVINVKLIYKYISDCMLGKIPPQLPPKESAMVLDLLREAKSIPFSYDFEEERKFVRDFKGATKFKPFKVKDEFKERLKQGPELKNDRNTVSVPEEIFFELSRHRRLVQSFNPLVVPAWMLQKEQEYVEDYLKESP